MNQKFLKVFVFFVVVQFVFYVTQEDLYLVQ